MPRRPAVHRTHTTPQLVGFIIESSPRIAKRSAVRINLFTPERLAVINQRLLLRINIQRHVDDAEKREELHSTYNSITVITTANRVIHLPYQPGVSPVFAAQRELPTPIAHVYQYVTQQERVKHDIMTEEEMLACFDESN